MELHYIDSVISEITSDLLWFRLFECQRISVIYVFWRGIGRSTIVWKDVRPPLASGFVSEDDSLPELNPFKQYTVVQVLLLICTVSHTSQ